MAQFDTSWDFNGATGILRLTIDDPPAIGHGTASVTLAAHAYLITNGAVVDSSNSNSLSGSISQGAHAVSVNHAAYPTGGTTEVCSASNTFATQFGSTVTVSVTATISGYEAFSGTHTVSGSVTIAARPYGAPAAPSGVGATRNSATQITVNWTNNPTTGEPYQTTDVQRSVDGGAFADISIGGSATRTSFVDTSVQPGHYYRYQVRAWNQYAGASAWVATGNVLNVPATPAAPTIGAVTQCTATVSFTLPSNGGSAITNTIFRLYSAATGGTLLASDPDVSTVTSYVFTGLTPYTDYWAEVAVTNGVGTSSPSPRSKITTSPSGYVKVAGAWKPYVAYVNVGGVWKVVAQSYVNVGGVWKTW